MLDRILDKGLVVDPAYRLAMMEPAGLKDDRRLVIGFIQTCTTRP